MAGSPAERSGSVTTTRTDLDLKRQAYPLDDPRVVVRRRTGRIFVRRTDSGGHRGFVLLLLSRESERGPKIPNRRSAWSGAAPDGLGVSSEA